MGNPGNLDLFFGSTYKERNLPTFITSPLRFAEIERKQCFDNGYAYLKWPMSLNVPDLAICKGSQMGFTSMVINIVIVALVNKTPGLYLLPTDSAIQDFSAARFNDIIRCSSLAGCSGTDNVGLKTINGTPLYLRGAKSESKLKEIPVALLILDECDEMSESAICLALERLTGCKSPRVIRLSTPRLSDTGIYKETSLRDLYMYLVRCSACGKEQSMDITNVDIGAATFMCSICKKPWSDLEREDLVRRGSWRQIQKGNGLYGLRINQLYSPTISAASFSRAFVEAQGNDYKLQVLYNSKLGLPYEAKGSRLSGAQVDAAVGECPSGEGLKVAGIDVSQTSQHYCVVGRALPYGLYIDEIKRVSWEDLPKFLRVRGVQTTVIDSRPETHSARLLAAAVPNTLLAQYVPTKQPYTLDESTGLVNINRTEAIDGVFARFNNGTILINHNNTEYLQFKTHIYNTVRGYRTVKGQPEAYYYEVGPDHYLHALTYAHIAASVVSSRVVCDLVRPDKFF